MATDMVSYFAFPFIKSNVTEQDVMENLHNQGFNLKAPSQRSRTCGVIAKPFWRQRLVWRQFDYLRERLARV